MVDKSEWIWSNGEWRRFDDARVHVLTHSLHYGLGAFEGIRCYKSEGSGGAIFRLEAHIERLRRSCRIAGIPLERSTDELCAAAVELVKKNNLQRGCYIRPIVFMGAGTMGLGARNNPIECHIAAWKWGAYLGDEGVEHGIRCKISSYRRASPDVLHSKGKITGHYVNSMMAKQDAIRDGYHEAILCDAQGYICEGSGENIFVVIGNKLITPHLGQSILDGITRDTLLTLAQEEGLGVEEQAFGRDHLFIADEVFLCGTAAEVTPVREIDGRIIGEGRPGPITTLLKNKYAEVVGGQSPKHEHWLSRVSA